MVIQFVHCIVRRGHTSSRTMTSRCPGAVAALWRIIATGAALLILATTPIPVAAELPPRPDNNIWDEPEALRGTLSNSPIQDTVSQLADDLQIDLMVVIVEDVADHDVYFLKTIAAQLFELWNLGSQDMMLLADRENRRAHIQPGPGWDADAVRLMQKIQDRLVLPDFEAGFFLSGLENGVKGLNAVARGLPLPKRRTWWRDPTVVKILLAVYLVGVVFNLFFRYRSSWIYVAIPYLGGCLFLAEYYMLRGDGRGKGRMGGGCSSAGCGGCGGCGGG